MDIWSNYIGNPYFANEQTKWNVSFTLNVIMSESYKFDIIFDQTNPS